MGVKDCVQNNQRLFGWVDCVANRNEMYIDDIIEDMFCANVEFHTSHNGVLFYTKPDYYTISGCCVDDCCRRI